MFLCLREGPPALLDIPQTQEITLLCRAKLPSRNKVVRHIDCHPEIGRWVQVMGNSDGPSISPHYLDNSRIIDMVVYRLLQQRGVGFVPGPYDAKIASMLTEGVIQFCWINPKHAISEAVDNLALRLHLFWSQSPRDASGKCLLCRSNA